MELKEIESAIEGVLFAAGEPVGVERLCFCLLYTSPSPRDRG